MPTTQSGGEQTYNLIQPLYARLYAALCSLLSGKADPSAWSGFCERDWGAFLMLAEGQGVAPLVYWRLEASGWSHRLPAAVRASLRRLYYQSAAQNSLLRRELESILEALAAAHIPVIVLKGAHLAVALYPDIALRPMHDLDLLVHEGDFENARQVLTKIGYTEPFPVLSQKVTREVGFELYLSKPNAQTPGVELHWGLVGGRDDRRSPPLSWFWENSQPFLAANRLQDVSYIRALTPTANLLYLCGPLFRDHGRASELFLWLYDIHLLLTLQAGEINWQTVMEKAQEFGWLQPVFSGLWATQSDFHTPLPPDLLDELQSHYPGLIPPQRGVFRAHPHHAQATWEALMHQRGWARLRLALAVLFPSPAHLRWRWAWRRAIRTSWIVRRVP